MKQNARILFHGGPMDISAKSAYDRAGHRKYLTRAEGEKFLARASQLPKLRALFCLTLYYTGCRISEALNLTGIDFDLELKAVRIRSLKKRDQEEVRRIPLPAFLVSELLKITASFPDQRIWAFSRITGWRIIRSVMNTAEISGIHATCKGLRHGFGVRAALEQIPLSQIQRWMGHADPTTTAIYLDVQDKEERALIKRTW